jgi:hypothetical protein
VVLIYDLFFSLDFCVIGCEAIIFGNYNNRTAEERLPYKTAPESNAPNASDNRTVIHHAGVVDCSAPR